MKLSELKTKELGKGVVFYPTKYNLNRDSIFGSYAEGVTLGGKKVVAYIIPTDSNQDKHFSSESALNAPNFNEFSKTSLKAKNPCKASESNSKNKPHGVLLLEQVLLCKELESKHDGKTVLVAQWASVISEGNHDTEGLIGKGFLEIASIGKPDQELVNYELELKSIQNQINQQKIEPMQVEERRRELYKKIIIKKKKKFTAVLVLFDKTYVLRDNNIDSYKKVIKRALLANTKDGKYGGCMVRVRNKKTVLLNSSFFCNHRYDYTNKRIDNIDNVITDFLKFGGMKAFNNGFKNDNVLEIIPTIRINCGSNGNDRYSKEIERAPLGNSKILKTYIEPWDRESADLKFVKNKSHTFSDIALRLSSLETYGYEGNILLSAIHAFSAPKGNVFSINSKGISEYSVQR